MVRARYSRNDYTHSLVVVGHAGYSSEGNDIVCSGVSAIVYSLLGFLHNAVDKDDRLTASVDSGESLIFWKGNSVEVNAAFQMAVIGLAQMAKKHPHHVSVEISAEGA